MHQQRYAMKITQLTKQSTFYEFRSKRHELAWLTRTRADLSAACSITTGARAEVKTRTAVYGAHVGGCVYVWPARARTVA